MECNCAGLTQEIVHRSSPRCHLFGSNWAHRNHKWSSSKTGAFYPTSVLSISHFSLFLVLSLAQAKCSFSLPKGLPSLVPFSAWLWYVAAITIDFDSLFVLLLERNITPDTINKKSCVHSRALLLIAWSSLDNWQQLKTESFQNVTPLLPSVKLIHLSQQRS